MVNLYGQRQLAVAVVSPVSSNDSSQPFSGLEMKFVQFDYIEIHPIHVCLNCEVNYSLSLLIWHHMP